MGRTVCVVVVALGACADRAPSGHERMVALLGEIAARASDQNPFQGTHEARRLEARLPGLGSRPLAEQIATREKLGTAYLQIGREQEAVALLKETRALVDRAPEAVPLETRLSLLFALGVASLRLGEIENCCARWTPESCIVPIRGGGLHTRPEGSRGAMEAFTRIAEATPRMSAPHMRAIWLLNIAAMTLGEHPDGVPEPYRLPLEAFVGDEEFPRFASVAAELGLDTFSLAGGAVADDFDNDGDLDLIVSDSDTKGQIRFFRNAGDGAFEDRTKAAGLTGILGGLNLVQADYDNDGFLDVFVLRGAWWADQGRHPNSLLRNGGDGTFRDVTFEAGLGEVHYPTQTAAWADYDNDGDVDLYVGNETEGDVRAPGQLFRNEGDGTFTDVAATAGVLNLRYAKAAVWGDYDADGWPDLYVSNCPGANRLYRNLGDGTFADVAERLGATGPDMSFPAWFWDYDNDGHLDLYVASYAGSIGQLANVGLGNAPRIEVSRLYRGVGGGRFRDVARAAGVDRLVMPMGSNFGDLDNDGYLDFYLGTGAPPLWQVMPNTMYWNRGGERFVDVAAAGGFGHLQKGHAVVFADLDNDGDQDVFEQMGGAYAADGFRDVLYRNPGFENRWVGVHLIGVRSNRSAIGARIRVVAREAGRTRSFYRHVTSGGSFGANPLRQTIGLGRTDAIERIEVYWPTTGRTQTVRGVAMDRHIRIVEGRKEPVPLDLRRFALASLEPR